MIPTRIVSAIVMPFRELISHERIISPIALSLLGAQEVFEVIQ
jgi:hypothetical protein